ncbi:unnamed protein product [Dibothriocephalus latus]|uniref:G-protein coupled receptors family 1 profile domain-containing protein n=1 Tax=Dibothriocephalus latus TaxID=60516 RepID=A0A3P6T3S3_DIBLA|nr:unnamed protein product [Dibothriocephalus latus]
MNSSHSHVDMPCVAFLKPSPVATIAASVVMTIFLAVGVLGNAWIIWILWRSDKMRKNLINTLIMSLCCNDIINLIFVQSLVLHSYCFGQWLVGTFLCFVVPEANMIFVGVSLWHHAFIAIHRYVIVVHWIFYRHMHKKMYLRFVVVGSRLLPLALSICFNSISLAKFYETQSDSVNTISAVTAPSKITRFLGSVMFYSPFLLRCVYKKSEGSRIVAVMSLTVILPCVIVLISFTSLFIYVRKKGLTLGRQLKKARTVGTNCPTSLYDDSEQLTSTYLPNSTAVSVPFKGSELDYNNYLSPPKSHLQTDSISEIQNSELGPPQSPQTKFAGLLRRRNSCPNLVGLMDKRRISRELSITKMFAVIFLLFLAGYLPYGFFRMMDKANVDPADCSPAFNQTHPDGIGVEEEMIALIPLNRPRYGQIQRPVLSPMSENLDRGISPNIYVFLSVLYAVASCCNPLIFGVMHRDIRKRAVQCVRTLCNKSQRVA